MGRRGVSCLDEEHSRGLGWSQESESGVTGFTLVTLDAFGWAPSLGQTWFSITSITSTMYYNHPNGGKQRKRCCHTPNNQDRGRPLAGPLHLINNANIKRVRFTCRKAGRIRINCFPWFFYSSNSEGCLQKKLSSTIQWENASIYTIFIILLLLS